MRSIGRLHDQRQAATLIDYLLTQGIRSKAERIETPDAATAWELWVFDEDRRLEAKEAFEAFIVEPYADRFLAAPKEAERLRQAEVEREFEIRRKQSEANRVAFPRRSGRRPITMTLLVVSCLVFLMVDGGESLSGQSVVSNLSITALRPIGGGMIEYQRGLPEIRSGEVWRLVTPIFLHGSILHLLFNMIWLMDFGTRIEQLRGSRTMLVFTILFAASGNFAQYWFTGPTFRGMSGVVMGLFGYVWMKAHFEPQSGFSISPVTIAIMLISFVAGLIDAVPGVSIANYCHGIGLVLGLICGYAPTFFRSLRKSG